jgi:multidrug efflux pump subunit AcrB
MVPTVRFTLRHKKATLLVTVWLFGIPVWLLPEKIETPVLASLYNPIFGSKFYSDIRPYMNYLLGGSSHLFFNYVTKGEFWSFGSETYIVVSIDAPPGTEIERLDGVMRGVEEQLARSGNQIQKTVTRVSNDGYASMRILFSNEVSQTAFPYLLKAHLTAYLSQVGGVNTGVYGYGPGFYTGGESAPSYHIKILGYNYNQVKQIAKDLQRELERNPRVANVEIERSYFGRKDNITEIAVTVERQALARCGLSVADIIRLVRSYSRGTVSRLEQFKVEGEQLNYVVKYAGYHDFSVDTLQQIIVRTLTGTAVRLEDIVTIAERRTLGQIVRENQQYQRWVSFDYKGPYKYGDQFVDRVVKNAVLPAGYSVERPQGFFFFREREEREIFWVILLSVLIVFMVTAALYESLIKPFVIILAIPMSLIGVFLAFYLSDTNFDRGGYASVILLAGIAVNNSIVLVDYIARRHKRGMDLTEAIVLACRHRIRPILMTTLTTIAGLIPLVVDEKQGSFWYSLAVGTIGGLALSTVLILLVVPGMYLVLVTRCRKISAREITSYIT